jgi:hypothetical protein
MTFAIQVSNPKISGDYDPEDETLDECVETSFLLNTELALVEWLGIFIPLHYKYTISTILLDILIMLQALLDKQHGELDITWPSNDFNGRWIMSWKDDSLTIKAQWNSVIGKTESLLNDLSELEVSKSGFICEWKVLLETVINGLVECGYNESQVSDLSKLKAIYSRIHEVGMLYK